jgi:hypothetical protein
LILILNIDDSRLSHHGIAPGVEPMKAACRRFIFVLGLTPILLPTAGLALTYPFNENFEAGTADWRENANANVDHVATGGIYDSGYVTTEFSFTSADNLQEAVFRGQNNFDSSGDAFVGNWLAAEVSRLRAFVRHDAPVSLDFFVRVATSGNSPAVSFTQPLPVTPGASWTKLDFDISFANPFRTNEGPPTLAFYNNVMANVGNVQIGVIVPVELADDPQTFTFDLDRIGIVPEPSSVMLALCGVALALVRRRRA